MAMHPSADQFRTIAEIGGDVAWVVDCATGLPTYISQAVEPLVAPIARNKWICNISG